MACEGPKERIPSSETMQRSNAKIIIYQMMTRLFGNKTSANKPFGTIEENGVGKFNDITDRALTQLKEMGITHVWYTGVIEHALVTDYTEFGIPADDPDVVKGRAGSPYSIKDYYDVNPDLAASVPDRMKEFEALIDRTHKQGLKAIIDFVPNHVARGYRSDAKPENVRDLGEDDDKSLAFSPNNNFYYLPGQSFTPPRTAQPFPAKDGKYEETPAKATGNDRFVANPSVDDWYECVKLNYGVDIENNRQTHFDPVPDTWNKMRDILLFWTSKKVDGFRCDMAEMVPIEFWNWVIPQVKEANPEIVFIAEVYNPDRYREHIQTGHFDYLYDKVLLYDTLRLLVNGQRKATDIAEIQERLNGINQHMLHFLENHDEQRVASRQFAGGPWKAVPAMVISATIDRGPVMIYFGQEVGEPGAGAEGFSGDDGRTTHFDYWGVPEHQKWMNDGKFDGGGLSAEQRQLRQFYSDVLNMAGKNAALTDGEYFDITAHNRSAGNIGDNVHVFLRFLEDERLLIVNSFNEKEIDIKIQIPSDAVNAMALDDGQVYIARDMIWREIEVGFDENYAFELHLKPYSSFIFKIK